MVAGEGLEPPTRRLSSDSSTIELTRETVGHREQSYRLQSGPFSEPTGPNGVTEAARPAIELRNRYHLKIRTWKDSNLRLTVTTRVGCRRQAKTPFQPLTHTS